MHECILCKRDMRKSKYQFGTGCIDNVFKFLKIEEKPKRKEKEKVLYKNVMERTNKLGLNKQQQIWLTDRYLTYEYLEKLPYGNFEALKRNINRDIERVNKIKKFEELKTAREMQLKQTYDLYKKERKFQENLNKLKEQPEDLVITEGKIIEDIKKDKNFTDKIKQIIEKYGSGKNEFTVTEENKESIAFKDSDLYFAIHKASIELNAEKEKDKWKLNITLRDKYDYSEFKSIKKYYSDTNKISKSIFSSTLYNLAHLSIKLGVMKEYYICVQFMVYM